MTLAPTDAAVFSAVRVNARKRIREYAADLSLPKSTVHDRLRSLFRRGLRTTTTINWEAAGIPITAIVCCPDVSLALDYRVNTCVRVATGVIGEIICRNLRELEELRERYPRANIYPVIRTMKREGFIPQVTQPTSVCEKASGDKIRSWKSRTYPAPKCVVSSTPNGFLSE